MATIRYVNRDTGRIIVDTNTIEAPDSIENYQKMTPIQFEQYCIDKRRELDASKKKYQEDLEAFNNSEDKRVDEVATQISTTMGISKEDALLMVPKQQYHAVPDWSVSEKVFGGVVLPEEESDV